MQEVFDEMNWFKHKTNASYHDPVLVALEAKYGLEGYARYFKLREIIISGLEVVDGTAPSITIDDKKLCDYLKCNRRVLYPFLETFAKVSGAVVKCSRLDSESKPKLSPNFHKTFTKLSQNLIFISVPSWAESLDKNAVSSTLRRNSGAPRIEQNRTE